MLKSADVINIVSNTLNYVEPRLANHGKRVAYIVFKMLMCQAEKDSRYDKKQIRDICFVAMLHDIGAYKTEDIERMISFETDDIWAHSIFGYLFLKHFSPLAEWAPAVLYHHADCAELKGISSDLQKIAQIIFIADRVDVISLLGFKSKERFAEYFEKKKDIKFYADIVSLLFESGVSLPFREDEINEDTEFNSLFYGMDFTESEIESYLKMTVLSIEFRSPQTVNHTIVMDYISGELARLLSVSEAEIGAIHIGAILHDLGKIGVPVSVLEKTDRLTPHEFEIIKTHVDLTESILTGHIDTEIERIALRHHEKLDGSGYPKGLTSEELTLQQRLVAVADIFSALCGVRSYKNAYPKEKIIAIMNEMSDKGFIDRMIVDVLIANFDRLLLSANQVSLPILEVYEKINDEYAKLLSKTKLFSADKRQAMLLLS